MTALGGATILVGIIGWPVEQSLSPRMHNAAFAALGLDWAYVPLPVRPERLEGSGFRFEHAELEPTLRTLLRPRQDVTGATT